MFNHFFSKVKEWSLRVARHYLLTYKRQPKRRKLAFWLFIIIILIAIPAGVDRINHEPGTADFYYLQVQDYIAVGRAFKVELHVRTGGEAINAVGAHLKFNPFYLEVASMTTDKSFCTFYTENTFDNQTGEISLSCGTPNPGFQGDSMVVSLMMRAKFPGNATITPDPEYTQILANDGKGSNIMKELPELKLYINQI